MKQEELYERLVDLYVGDELPEELMEEFELASTRNRQLAQDMHSLRQTVEMLRAIPQPKYREESFHRILFKLYAGGANPQPKSSPPAYFQYQLPING